MDKIDKIILATIFLIIITTILIVNAYMNIPRNSFTELYFEKIDQLDDKDSNIGSRYFSFTIENHEKDSKTYNYLVTSIYNDEEHIIEYNSIKIPKGKSKTISQLINLNNTIKSALVKVTLPDQNQEIHFWID
ncbi:hypothetical protein J4471_01100 [Candidatus Woesearchaeota archaeon]|nr:hypothetical protein [Candidatus Woesearchaeota archaeon]